MTTKDRQLRALMKKLNDQEIKIVEFQELYNAKEMITGYTKKERQKLKEPQPEGYVPLDERIQRYTMDTTDVDFVDPLEIAQHVDMFKRPFEFYGGYTKLST